jgi:hypothetical protein
MSHGMPAVQEVFACAYVNPYFPYTCVSNCCALRCCRAASNYRGGRAESTIGAALTVLLTGHEQKEFRAGRAEVTRDALFISTKAGFIDAGEHDKQAGQSPRVCLCPHTRRALDSACSVLQN